MPLIVAYNGPINVFSCHFVFRLVMIFSDKWTKKLYCLDKEKEKIFKGCTASTIQALYKYFISVHFYSNLNEYLINAIKYLRFWILSPSRQNLQRIFCKTLAMCG